MRYLLVFAFSFFTSSVFAQYWFGPKIGFSYIDHIFQESTYESDSFNIPKNWNFQAGLAVSYSATDRYAVYGELLYEKIGKKITDLATDGENVSTEMTNHFLSVPVMLRITLGRVPFHYYINGGPRISFWLGGKGKISLEEFDESTPAGIDENENALPVEYTITFKESALLEADNFDPAYISNPNRLQFGLTAGGGLFFDIQGGGRLQFDFRYTWVHSNMGTNDSDDFLAFDSYRENFEYYHGIATLGVAYMFDYNSQLKRKGKSTARESNKKKK
ncbi:MAG: PorT family protein [Ekhidna sp.]|nr:PorT family protein [Ekhidna sp.]MBC6409314.1 PorT family protein [Ekhidna sp.]